jgi:hypothetical protein
VAPNCPDRNKKLRSEWYFVKEGKQHFQSGDEESSQGKEDENTGRRRFTSDTAMVGGTCREPRDKPF